MRSWLFILTSALSQAQSQYLHLEKYCNTSSPEVSHLILRFIFSPSHTVMDLLLASKTVHGRQIGTWQEFFCLLSIHASHNPSWGCSRTGSTLPSAHHEFCLDKPYLKHYWIIAAFQHLDFSSVQSTAPGARQGRTSLPPLSVLQDALKIEPHQI